MKYESDWWLGGFLAAFLTGLAITLVYTWYLVPGTPSTTPAKLNQADKETYILLVAAAYHHDNDLPKAKRRLAKLKDARISKTVADLAEAAIRGRADVRDIRALAGLAAALGETRNMMLVYLTTPTATPAPTSTPNPTPTPTPSPTLTPTVAPKSTASPTITPRATPKPASNHMFELAQSVALCDNTSNRLLRVYVIDKKGEGVPGVAVKVSWPGGKNTFYTGFKSDANPGYADFRMAADQIYQVDLADVSAAGAKDINHNADTQCLNLPADSGPSWQVVFEQK